MKCKTRKRAARLAVKEEEEEPETAATGCPACPAWVRGAVFQEDGTLCIDTLQLPGPPGATEQYAKSLMQDYILPVKQCEFNEEVTCLTIPEGEFKGLRVRVSNNVGKLIRVRGLCLLAAVRAATMKPAAFQTEYIETVLGHPHFPELVNRAKELLGGQPAVSALKDTSSSSSVAEYSGTATAPATAPLPVGVVATHPMPLVATLEIAQLKRAEQAMQAELEETRAALKQDLVKAQSEWEEQRAGLQQEHDQAMHKQLEAREEHDLAMRKQLEAREEHDLAMRKQLEEHELAMRGQLEAREEHHLAMRKKLEEHELALRGQLEAKEEHHLAVTQQLEERDLATRKQLEAAEAEMASERGRSGEEYAQLKSSLEEVVYQEHLARRDAKQEAASALTESARVLRAEAATDEAKAQFVAMQRRAAEAAALQERLRTELRQQRIENGALQAQLTLKKLEEPEVLSLTGRIKHEGDLQQLLRPKEEVEEGPDDDELASQLRDLQERLAPDQLPPDPITLPMPPGEEWPNPEPEEAPAQEAKGLEEEEARAQQQKGAHQEASLRARALLEEGAQEETSREAQQEKKANVEPKKEAKTPPPPPPPRPVQSLPSPLRLLPWPPRQANPAQQAASSSSAASTPPQSVVPPEAAPPWAAAKAARAAARASEPKHTAPDATSPSPPPPPPQEVPNTSSTAQGAPPPAAAPVHPKKVPDTSSTAQGAPPQPPPPATAPAHPKKAVVIDGQRATCSKCGKDNQEIRKHNFYSKGGREEQHWILDCTNPSCGSHEIRKDGSAVVSTHHEDEVFLRLKNLYNRTRSGTEHERRNAERLLLAQKRKLSALTVEPNEPVDRRTRAKKALDGLEQLVHEQETPSITPQSVWLAQQRQQLVQEFNRLKMEARGTQVEPWVDQFYSSFQRDQFERHPQAHVMVQRWYGHIAQLRVSIYQARFQLLQHVRAAQQMA